MTELNISKQKKLFDIENVIPTILFIIASVSVLTSIGIVITLVVDASHFFLLKYLYQKYSVQNLSH